MFSETILMHRRLKIDTKDAVILESLDKRIITLMGLCDSVGEPGKIQMMAARLKRLEKHGWIATTAHPKSKRDKVRKLTVKGRRLLNEIRAHVVQVTCGANNEE